MAGASSPGAWFRASSPRAAAEIATFTIEDRSRNYPGGPSGGKGLPLYQLPEALVTALAIEARASDQSVTPPPGRALAHIPGDDGWPLIGSTLEALADPKRFFEQRAAKHGLVVRANILGETAVNLLGPEANEFVLFDQQRLFSSRLGWERFLVRLFPRGLMMMDFDEHRLNRRALSVAFKAGPMKAYLTALDASIAAQVAQWRAKPGPMLIYPAMKQLTLDLAATSFLGTPLGAEMDGVTAAFKDMVAAITAPIRKPLPGTAMSRGVRGRAHIVAWFTRQVPIRRDSGGEDLFSELCRARTEDGELLSTQAVVDHMSFFLMAAHDTLTSSLTGFVWLLGANPAWQVRLRDEIAGLGLSPGEPLPYDRLETLKLTEMAFRETLRMIPPVPALSRRALRDFTFGGYHIPAGASVGVNTLFTHYMPAIWPDPDRFDPERFTESAQTERHRFAFVPFGGGAHMCLGLNFAYMQAKCFARHLLQSLSISIEPGYTPAWTMWPIPRPRDGLRVTLTPA
jgi:cytochrome P450